MDFPFIIVSKCNNQYWHSSVVDDDAIIGTAKNKPKLITNFSSAFAAYRANVWLVCGICPIFI
ncbi:hypothetical protein [Methylocucumis oryzae]|uniref:Uncharacterized protein n=1 Tax=Methylocucumis oryzae TaxID=1632867 RepID=A0A0F3IL58_9GAMM|nr:hypothetical protein [Methylocucumis oryzae]KJV07451.1 hypothetical protein VZ94_04680 [Methylocucumis oryzae]